MTILLAVLSLSMATVAGVVLGYTIGVFRGQSRPERHVHEWGRWKDTSVEVVSAGILSGSKVGTHFIGQERLCETCGISQLRGK